MAPCGNRCARASGEHEAALSTNTPQARPGMSKMHESASIAIVGAGSIGTGWAIVFAMAGHAVRLFDPSGARVGVAPEEIAARVEDLRACGLCPEPSAQVLERISASP